jgi:phosphoenolpyruvate carboxykinase (ATP)
VLIGGTDILEKWKGIFSALNFIYLFSKIHYLCTSANVGKDGDTAIFFGLSGTGKQLYLQIQTVNYWWWWTRMDQWNTVFNFEGGCYAKVINLTEENEPDILER